MQELTKKENICSDFDPRTYLVVANDFSLQANGGSKLGQIDGTQFYSLGPMDQKKVCGISVHRLLNTQMMIL